MSNESENTTPTEGAPSATAQPASGPDDLQRELEAARAKADEYYRAWQRSAADFANFKRRIDEEKRYAERWLIQDLLPVLDDFDRAWQTLPRELLKLTWVEGVWQIHAKLSSILERHGLKPIEAEGKEFNPIEHEAVLREEEGDPSEQTAVTTVLQRGYRLHERVIRPALVKVGRPKAAAEPAPEHS